VKLDLHLHSQYSPDGALTLAEIVKTAKARGLDGVAVCDHDRLITEKLPDDFMIIRGCEFSTEYGHLLGLFLKEPISVTGFENICKEIHAQGGIAVLAHPYQHKKYRDIIEKALPHIDGVEVINSRATRKNPRANAQAFDLAKKHRLAIFGGSDAHTKGEIGNAYTRLENTDDIKKALLEGRVTVCGRRAKSLCTAKSQLVKIRKTKKGNIPKWFLFAAKCIFEDIIHIKESKYVTYSKDW
jgi:predicted metal-dependent phosphoesterase TrpH